MWLLTLCFGFVMAVDAHAQSPRSNAFDVPQTNLQPIGPPPGMNAPSTFSGSPTYNAPPSTYVPPASNYAAPPPTTSYPTPGATLGTAAPTVPYNRSLVEQIFSGSVPPRTPAYNAPGTIGAPVGYGSPYGTTTVPPPNLSPPGLPPVYASPPPAYNSTPGYGAPTYSPSYPTSPYAQSPYSQPSYPGSPYPQSAPTSLYPGGMFSDMNLWDTATMSAYRFLQGPRFRYTYIGPGGSGDNFSINDFDTSVVFAWQNFLFSSQPLMIAPSFSLHLWDGPDSSTGADLPGNAYSGFLDLGWQSDPNQIFGVELGLRFGAFTDFNTFNDDSLRLMGKALGSFRLTPASTLKAGVHYLDRNKVKLLPAGGLLYQPTPYSRCDIFFPQPKFSKYCRTVGTQDVWGYVAGEYGGGAWTVQRASGAEDSVDINDLRIMFGLEWGQHEYIRAGRRNSFIEIGYVWNREIEYRYNPQDNIKPSDAFMLRMGIGY
ncbi:hypothetical protein [Novipirellula herctigrandis]